MITLDTSEENLKLAGRALAEGKLVAIPTETVYGLGADAFNAAAVARVFEAKARPSFDPLIVHIARIEDLEKIASSIPPKAKLLADHLWPGPLTMILPKRSEVPDIVTSGLPTAAVRFPQHPVARKIIEFSGTAIAAPSANPFGYISPTRAEHVARLLGEKIDYLVDGGACEVGVESTVIDMTHDLPKILRPGGMPVERIIEIIGPVEFSVKKSAVVSSPGQLDSHYAPSTQLFLFEYGTLNLGNAHRLIEGMDPGSAAAIVFNDARAKEAARAGFSTVFTLSSNGNLRDAAANLFALLHELDSRNFSVLVAEKCPDEGLGRAINDRLYRASVK